MEKIKKTSGYTLLRLKEIAEKYSYSSRLSFDGRHWRVCLYDNYFRSPYPRILYSYPFKDQEYVKKLFNF